MRKIFIDLSSDNYLQQPKMFGGYEGEHNETYLQVKLPKRMIDIECSGYRFDFQTSEGNEIPSPLIPVSELKDDILSFHLIEQLTVAGKLIFTVVAIRAGQNTVDLISKTNTVILCIEDSPKGKVQLIDPNGYKDELLKMVDARILETSPPVIIDKTYNPESENAQSGKAVAKAVSEIKIPSIPEVDKAYNPQSENAQSGKAVAEALETKADNSDVSKKQNTLVSGENIKTINGESILGSGNIEIQGGSVVDITIDQNYSPKSENPQSGTAVAEALKAQYGDVVSLITTPRKYNTADWEIRGAKGYYTDWSNISNKDKLKVGQIGLLPGLNITNNEPVILVGEIKEITEYMVWLESITWIQLTGCKGKDGAKGADGTVSFDNLTDAQKASLKGDTGPQGPQGPRGPQGPQGPTREATYHKFRDLQNVDDFKFELQKGHLYSFTVDNDDVNSAYIVDTNGKKIAGVAGKTLSGMKNGFVICADRCSGGGLTGELSILNPTAFVTDRWDWDDYYREQYGPYYLRITKTDGIDIWEI